jgi:uncharacterized protein YegL
MEIMGLNEVERDNTSVEELDSEVVNLINVLIDQSGSMDSFSSDMKKSLEDFKDSTSNSREADTILVSRINFMESKVDISGYKKIGEFDTDFEADGYTPLFDAINEGVDKLTNNGGTGYMDYLKQQGMRVKAVFSVFSDGYDNNSNAGFDDAKAKISYLNKKEVVTACICFGSEAKDQASRLGFKNILAVNSSSSELRKAFDCLSKSVAENSKSVVNKVDDFFEV